MAPINVAIAGATGKLGIHVAKAFFNLPSYSQDIGRVLVFTRNASSPNAQELKDIGAELGTNVSSPGALKGIDVAIDVLKGDAGEGVHNVFAQAAFDAGVKVYFPYEYGMDHTAPGARQDHKAAYDKFARSLGGGMKVVSLFNGSFTENLDFGAMLGLDYENGAYSAVGSADVRNTFTTPRDVANAIVSLSLLATQSPASVPDYITISGDAKSYREIAEIVRQEKGQGSVKIDVIPIEEWLKTPDGFVKGYRLMFGTGQADYSTKNHNELVNPGEQSWKWEDVKDWAEAKKGSFAPPAWGGH